jgi:hypothetical protein
MEWKLIEEPLGPNPVEVCQDIVKSGVGAETDKYKDCTTFLVNGEYSITTHDWKTTRERTFRFEDWKLAAIVEKFSAKERDDIGRELNLKFGAPQKSDSASASWQKSDAKIQVFYRDDGGAILVVPPSSWSASSVSSRSPEDTDRSISGREAPSSPPDP